MRTGLRALLESLADKNQEVGSFELVSILSEASGSELDLGLERDTLQGVLEYFGMVCPSSSSAANEPLDQKLKMIQAATKMMKGSRTRYGEIFGQVAGIGVLQHLEAIGVSISPVKGSTPASFADKGLLRPSLDVALAWEAFQATWKADMKL
ncbi:hypothetical protein GUJ93_ZPchr0015g6903 [Zizania palustris]|uniref:Uncharacterized protein n=1 Tax=Zizania palustris TaxID=103762 RepID=A0A8J5SYG3_ZIZPA|nr:hypothetical protein GUJ93_ZPchr0015g6903 [Zizania palustris]